MGFFKDINISVEEQNRIWNGLSESSQKSIKEKFDEVYRISLLDYEFRPQKEMLISIFGEQNLK